VQVWEVEGWKPVGPQHSFPANIVDVTMDAKGSRIAVLQSDGQISVRDVVSGEVKASFSTEALSVSFSMDGHRLLTVGANSARTWDSATGQPISPEVDHASGHTNAKFSPNGRLVLQWGGKEPSGQAHATIWDAVTGQTRRKLAGHWQGIGGAAWSPDGRLIATGGADQTLLLSDAESGALVVPPIKHAQKVAAVGFSKDGLLMWSLAEKEITVWSTVSGEPVTPRLRQLRVPVAITMDGATGRDLAVVGFRSTPRIWHLNPDLRSPAELREIAHALSAHALVEGTSALRPLTLAELRGAWERARQAIGGW
jgi:WD40 repeat protein